MSQRMFNEQELVARLKGGERQAFEELYDRYSDALYGIVMRILQSEEQAQDCLQESFVKIWKKIQSYDSSKGKLFTWILNIARNTAIDLLRKMKRRHVQQEVELSEKEIGPSEIPVAKMNVDGIGMAEVIQKLPEELSLLIHLIYFQGYTQSEVAEEYNIPLGTVKSRIRRAMRELKTMLE